MNCQDERRQFKRVSLTHVTVDLVDSSGRVTDPDLCFIVNISESGMLLMAECPDELFLKNKMVHLTFTLPGNNVMIKTDAMIVYVQEKDLSQYIGLQFKNLGNKEQEYLIHFVNSSAE